MDTVLQVSPNNETILKIQMGQVNKYTLNSQLYLRTLEIFLTPRIIDNKATPFPQPMVMGLLPLTNNGTILKILMALASRFMPKSFQKMLGIYQTLQTMDNRVPPYPQPMVMELLRSLSNATIL